MKLKKPGRKKLKKQRFQRAKLCSDPLKSLKREPLVVMGYLQRVPSFLCLQYVTAELRKEIFNNAGF